VIKEKRAYKRKLKEEAKTELTVKQLKAEKAPESIPGKSAVVGKAARNIYDEDDKGL